VVARHLNLLDANEMREIVRRIAQLFEAELQHLAQIGIELVEGFT
jgi:hypothetical protein